MNRRNSRRDEAFVLKAEVSRAVTRASFGKTVNDNELASYHQRWNAVLRALHLPMCDFKESQSKSGCRLPMCPRCGLRARMRLCYGVLRWHWRDPSAEMALLDYHIHSQHTTAFLDLFDRSVQRACHGRARDRRQVLGNILLTSYAGKLPGIRELATDDNPAVDQSYWAHSRLTVFWYESGAEVTRIRGRRGDTGVETTSWSQFQTLDDLANDEDLDSLWRVPNHAGRLIIGGILKRMGRVTGYLFKDLEPVAELVAELRSPGAKRNFVRVHTPPGEIKSK